MPEGQKLLYLVISKCSCMVFQIVWLNLVGRQLGDIMNICSRIYLSVFVKNSSGKR